MIFNIRKNFICIFCGEKKTEGKRFRGGCGICSECNVKIERTPIGGTFEGRGNVEYVIAALFYEGLTRDAIMRYKFEGWSCNANAFYYIMKQCTEQFPHLKEFDLSIPVPLSFERYRERGFNQSLPLAKAVADAAGIKCGKDLLVKIRNTKRQSRLTSDERVNNVFNAYIAMPEVKGKRIILVDDIYTTGATMDECARTLKEAGAAEVIGVSLSIKYKKEKSLMSRY
jgi:competence protein ComFC